MSRRPARPTFARVPRPHVSGQGFFPGCGDQPAKLMRPKGVKGGAHGRLVTAIVDVADLPEFRERLKLTRTPAGKFVLETGRFVRGAEAGTSDVTGDYGGRYVAIEAKVGHDRLSWAQREFLRGVVRRGGWAFVCRDLVEPFKAALRAAIAGGYAPTKEIVQPNGGGVPS